MEARLIDRMIVNMERYWRLLGVQEDAEIIKDRLDLADIDHVSIRIGRRPAAIAV